MAVFNFCNYHEPFPHEHPLITDCYSAHVTVSSKEGIIGFRKDVEEVRPITRQRTETEWRFADTGKACPEGAQLELAYLAERSRVAPVGEGGA